MSPLPDAVAPLTVQCWGEIEWEAARRRQLELVVRRQRGEIADVLVLAQHPAVYTAGRSSWGSLPEELAGIPVRRAERGGALTYHGPGQLVGYPIVHLNRVGRDVHRFLRLLEEALCVGVRSLGLGGHRVEGLTGVWAEGCKIASIGIAVRRWVSFHGFALNVAGDLQPFGRIDPCGLRSVRMASLQSLGITVSLPEAARAVERAFLDVFGAPATVALPPTATIGGAPVS